MRVEHIGDATLYLGDCREILPTLGNIDAVVTDPPYGMAFRSNYRRLQRHAAIANDGDETALLFACDIPAIHSRYVFCRWDNLGSVPKPTSVITWAKNNWSMGDLEHEHARQTELILFYRCDGHRFPTKRPSDFIFCPRTDNANHPTEKPVSLMRAVIEWTAGCVVDPFMGSGTTGVAALSVGRPFVGIEVAEEHFDTACRRLAAAYKQPTLLAMA